MFARFFAAAAALLIGACASPRVIEQGEAVTAFRGVTVITEYGGDRLRNHTVVVRGDTIIALAPDRRLRLPPDATIIEGRGRLLAPGLADMHVHFFSDDDGALYLANSITTVRNMSGLNDRTQPQRIAEGALAGPTIYSAGQLIDGPGSFWGPAVETTSVEGVRERVRQNAAEGFIAAKLYAQLSPEQFAAGVEEARAHGLQVYAHVPASMTLQAVLAHRVDSIGTDLTAPWARKARTPSSAGPGPRLKPMPSLQRRRPQAGFG